MTTNMSGGTESIAGANPLTQDGHHLAMFHNNPLCAGYFPSWAGNQSVHSYLVC